MTEQDLENLMPALEFLDGVLRGDYDFAGNQWFNDADEVIGLGKMVQEYQKTYPQSKLYFQVDPKDKTSDTLVLVLPDNMGVWAAFNAFTEEFGTGDQLEAIEMAGVVHFFLWYD